MLRRVLIKLPIVYKIRVNQLRIKRSIMNLFISFARKRLNILLPVTLKRHQSLLRRKLGSSNPQLQENKVTNLNIAIKTIDGIEVNPGETFSFWKLVGKPTMRKGYIEGMQLSKGEVKTGIGGGLCQLSNLLYWLVLHTPMEIIERHHHSFDPFPDEHRVLPFGSGASVFFNYVDLRFRNSTNHKFQISLWLTELHLKGTILCDTDWPYSYHIEERNHQYHHRDGKNYRENEIWRKVIEKSTGLIIKEELIVHNFSEVKYQITC
jgi:vancomycin resistance protein VanW